MQSPTLNDVLRSSRFTFSLLWATLTLSIALYVVVAWVVASQRGEPTPLASNLDLAVGLAALLVAGLSLLVPRVLLSDDRVRAFLAQDWTSRDAVATGGRFAANAQTLPAIEALPEHERRLAALPALFFTPFILRLVLNEAVAIMGLVLAFLSGRFEPVLPFAAAAIVLNGLSFPRLDALVERARNLGGTTGGAL